jgi:hypothetical protein
MGGTLFLPLLGLQDLRKTSLVITAARKVRHLE